MQVKIVVGTSQVNARLTPQAAAPHSMILVDSQTLPHPVKTRSPALTHQRNNPTTSKGVTLPEVFPSIHSTHSLAPSPPSCTAPLRACEKETAGTTCSYMPQPVRTRHPSHQPSIAGLSLDRKSLTSHCSSGDKEDPRPDNTSRTLHDNTHPVKHS